MISVIRKDNEYKAVVSNCKDKTYNAKLTAYLLSKKDMTVIETYSEDATIDAYSPTSFTLPFEASEESIVVCDVDYGEGSDRSFYKDGALNITECTEKLDIKQNADGSVTLTAKEYVHIVELEGDGVFTDNYFTLLKGESKTVNFVPISDGDYTVTAYTLV